MKKLFSLSVGIFCFSTVLLTHATQLNSVSTYTCPDTYQGQAFQAATVNIRTHLGFCGYQTIQFQVPHAVAPYGGLWHSQPNTFLSYCGPGFPASYCQMGIIF